MLKGHLPPSGRPLGGLRSKVAAQQSGQPDVDGQPYVDGQTDVAGRRPLCVPNLWDSATLSRVYLTLAHVCLTLSWVCPEDAARSQIPGPSAQRLTM